MITNKCYPLSADLNATVDVTLMYLENQSQPLLLAQNIQINGVYM